MQERKEKAPSSLSSLLPPWPVHVPVLFSPGLHSVHSSLACQARAMLSASVVGTLARHGAEFRHLPGWGAREGGGTVGTLRPRSSRGSHCSADLTSSSEGNLRDQNKQQEQSSVKPFRGMWRSSRLFLFLFPWVCP